MRPCHPEPWACTGASRVPRHPHGPLPSPGGGVAACGPRGVTQTQCFDIRTLFQTNLVS